MADIFMEFYAGGSSWRLLVDKEGFPISVGFLQQQDLRGVLLREFLVVDFGNGPEGFVYLNGRDLSGLGIKTLQSFSRKIREGVFDIFDTYLEFSCEATGAILYYLLPEFSKNSVSYEDVLNWMKAFKKFEKASLLLFDQLFPRIEFEEKFHMVEFSVYLHLREFLPQNPYQKYLEKKAREKEA